MGTHAKATIFIGAKIQDVEDENGYEMSPMELLEEKYGSKDWEDAYDAYAMKMGLVSPWKSYNPSKDLTLQQLDEYFDKWKKEHEKELKEYWNKKYEMIESSGCRFGFSGDEYSGYLSMYICYGKFLDKTCQPVRCGEIVKIDPNEWKITEEMKTKIKEFARVLELPIGEIGIHVEVSYG